MYARLMKAGNLPRAKQPVIKVLMLEALSSQLLTPKIGDFKNR